jgi:hypothetical protein
MACVDGIRICLFGEVDKGLEAESKALVGLHT